MLRSLPIVDRTPGTKMGTQPGSVPLMKRRYRQIVALLSWQRLQAAVVDCAAEVRGNPATALTHGVSCKASESMLDACSGKQRATEVNSTQDSRAVRLLLLTGGERTALCWP